MSQTLRHLTKWKFWGLGFLVKGAVFFPFITMDSSNEQTDETDIIFIARWRCAVAVITSRSAMAERPREA